MINSYTADVLLGLFGLLNTALLVYQAVRLNQVHHSVNGARAAAVEASRQAGFLTGVMHATVGKIPTADVGDTPTRIDG